MLCIMSSNMNVADSNNQAQYEEVTQRPHEAQWSHELIGGAAAYEAAKAYEDHVSRNGENGPSAGLRFQVHLSNS